MRFTPRICRLVAGWLILSSSLPAGDAASTDTVLLPNRVLWTTSRVVGFPDPPPPYQVERVYPQLAFLKPLAVGAFPESGLMWVVTHEGGYGGPGRIQCFVDHPDVSTSEILLERPEIIYGAAFHPRFAENGYLFIGCNGQSEFLGKKATRVLRFTLERAPPFRCDPESARLIIEWPSNGHNGGDLTFGPDGMLYVSAGDGTSDSDPKLAGQDVTTLHGAIIRIDVDHPAGGQPYSVPADNPFVETPGARPEIWAYGLRNPWRMTFDRQTGQLWAGDNGQDLRETVHLVRRGQNYGWSVMEGSHPFQLERPRGPTPIVPPTIEHPHSEARSLTGGLVYHGDVLPDLDGAYVYGDYATGNIWGARYEGKVPATAHLLSRTSLQITGFGRNSRGDLLIVDHGGGLYRLIPRRPQPDLPPFPRRLSETGLFTSVRDHEPHPGMIPYSVNSPLWSDGADKQRLIGLPGTEKITFHSGKSWEFPNGTVLVKTFALNTTDEAAPAPATRRIETRLLTKQDNEWFGYSYEWHDDQSDATLVEAPGKDREYHVLDAAAGAALTQKWRFPSRSECMVCHTRAARFILGLNVPQMNKVHRYGVVDANQLEALEHWDVFQNPGSNDDAGSFGNTTPEFTLPQPPEELPRLVNPEDPSQPLEVRVRSYLHANCANCHVSAGGGNSLMNLAFGAPLEKMRIVDSAPQHDRLGIDDASIIAPGAPARSILLHRISRRGRAQMPPLATNRIDERGVQLIQEWITQMKQDPLEEVLIRNRFGKGEPHPVDAVADPVGAPPADLQQFAADGAGLGGGRFDCRLGETRVW